MRPSAPPVVLFVHAHYPDLWAEMAGRIAARMDRPFRLLVTTDRPQEAIPRPDSPFLADWQVLAVENRGRDILPFLRALAVAGEFEYGLKLHTKRSPQRPDGAAWRAALIDSLLPPEGPGGILDRLEALPSVGLVAPARFALSVEPWVLQNRAGMERLMGRLGADLCAADMEGAYFAAGSMFWFRRHALEPLADPGLPDLFEPEQGQLDGTAAHAMERLFPVIAKRQGQASMAVDALLQAAPGAGAETLAALAAAHADIPTPYFPGPGIPAHPAPAPPVAPPAPARAPARFGLRRALAPLFHALPGPVRRGLVWLLIPGARRG